MKSTSVICLVLAFVAACGVSGSARGDLILPQASSATKELVHEVVEALKVCSLLYQYAPHALACVRAILKLARQADTLHASYCITDWCCCYL